VICQTGGQTALRLSQVIKNIPILGTDFKEIDRAEDREKFDRFLQKLKLKRPQSLSVNSASMLEKAAKKLGFPVLIRPSYVLGGRSMRVVRSEADLKRFQESLQTTMDIHWPLLVDRFLEEAIEVDVDCIGDGREAKVIAVMEHIEEAGIHSGDSSCCLPPMTLSNTQVDQVRRISERMARELKISGFLNIQLAILNREIYVLEVNPRASRTLPYVCKACNFDWVAAATQAMLGKRFSEQSLPEPKLTAESGRLFAVKAVVFPFLKFPGVDVLLGPEMKSTGEVMCLGRSFHEAFVKGLLASNHRMPKSGTAFVSVRNDDKKKVVDICRSLKSQGFRIVATHGTSQFLRQQGIVNSGINKVKEGQPHIVDAIINGEIDLVINTVEGDSAMSDSFSIRRSALQTGVPYFTTLTAARAAVNSLESWIRGELPIVALQDLQAPRLSKARTSAAKKKKKTITRHSSKAARRL
jgi:carbamoyl-phosphate synthase large subunit